VPQPAVFVVEADVFAVGSRCFPGWRALDLWCALLNIKSWNKFIQGNVISWFADDFCIFIFVLMRNWLYPPIPVYHKNGFSIFQRTNFQQLIT
jgi:hypothetical protein